MGVHRFNVITFQEDPSPYPESEDTELHERQRKRMKRALVKGVPAECWLRALVLR